MSALKIEHVENLFPDYNLNFIDRSTEEKFRGKRLSDGSYVILIDPVLGLKETFTSFKFKKRFESDVSNRRYHNTGARKCKSIYHFQN
jgi:hypothetical protein